MNEKTPQEKSGARHTSLRRESTMSVSIVGWVERSDTHQRYSTTFAEVARSVDANTPIRLQSTIGDETMKA